MRGHFRRSTQMNNGRFAAAAVAGQVVHTTKQRFWLLHCLPLSGPVFCGWIRVCGVKVGRSTLQQYLAYIVFHTMQTMCEQVVQAWLPLPSQAMKNDGAKFDKQRIPSRAQSLEGQGRWNKDKGIISSKSIVASLYYNHFSCPVIPRRDPAVWSLACSELTRHVLPSLRTILQSGVR